MIEKGLARWPFTSSIGAFQTGRHAGHSMACPSLALGSALYATFAAEIRPKGLRFNGDLSGVCENARFARELWDNPKVENRIKNGNPAAPSWRGRGFRRARPCSLLLMQAANDAVRQLTVCGGSNMVDV